MPAKTKLNCDPILPYSRELENRKCSPVAEFTQELVDIVERLKRTMYYLNGQGIAAPQIGIFLQLALIYYEDRCFPIINPVIGECRGDVTAFESCLSLPGASSSYQRVPNHARVSRSRELVLAYQDINGKKVEEKFSDHPARIVQHETDHCVHGIFFMNRCSSLFREIVIRNHRNYMEGLEKGIIREG